MTLSEYYLRLEAYQLSEIKHENDLALQAWLNQQVQATKGEKHPKPIYKSFKQFYDREYMEEQLRSMYEPSYQLSRSTADHDQKERAYSKFNQNLELYRKLKASGKLDEIKKKRMGGGK